MQNPIPHIINDQIFWVTAERALFWEEQNTMIVADVHLGKSGHFRKAGIPIPQSVYKDDLQRLMGMFFFFKAERLIVVGDFTHSTSNKELDLFLKWRKDFSAIHIDLVKGNHDILEDDWYKAANIQVHEWDLIENGFLFRHEDRRFNLPERENVKYTFYGHLHPGYKISGKGLQTLKFPCYYFGRESCILPAFSRFTGTFMVKLIKGDTIYAVSGNELLKIG
ncbi:MAG TPA: ligase-associated DNA damage response endonuclease PdeM [Chitinophagaceae bacterium]|nr:ligase-associated DNA damage response endonuclease PdeM [Chitinophagaceae bacterium]